jgi:hypothetical protein
LGKQKTPFQQEILKGIQTIKFLSPKWFFILVPKRKQICIRIVSKEVLVALLIFVKSISVTIDPDVSRPSFSSAKVSPCPKLGKNSDSARR